MRHCGLKHGKKTITAFYRASVYAASNYRVPPTLANVQFALSNGVDVRNRSSALFVVEALPSFDGVLVFPRYLITIRISSGFPQAR